MKVEFTEFIQKLFSCKKCSNMIGPPIIGSIPKSEIISIGQAPGIHEAKFMKPFSYTAGKTLFKWIRTIGISEEEYRSFVNMSAVCRCFPGKAKSGDRKPSSLEIENCREYLEFEFKYHKPKLVIPIGKLAIDFIYEEKKYILEDVVGKIFRTKKYDVEFDWIALPHPSGLNVWNHTEIGKKLIQNSLELIQEHPAFRKNKNSIK